MFEFLSIAGRCKKSSRIAAYIVGCITAVTVVALITISTMKIVSSLSQYTNFSVNLFNLIEIEVSR